MSDYNLKVGDIITAYRSGFHRIVAFPNATAVDYLQVADQFGKTKKGKAVQCCHRFYCKPLSIAVDERLAKLEEEIKNLKMLKEYYE